MAEQLAKMREQVYEDPRPPSHFTKYHTRARTKKPNWVYSATRLIVILMGKCLFRIHGYGAENVPAKGPVIVAPNHFSYMDHFFVGKYVWPRKVRFMAKSQIFKYGMQLIYSPGGVFPVQRGRKDEEAMTTGRIILEKGELMVMYVQGGRSRTGEVDGSAKRGIGRYVLETGAPVVPVAIYGSERVRNWKRAQFPKVTVLFGKPMEWQKVDNSTREEQQAVADAVLAAIRKLYANLEKSATARRRLYPWWRRVGRKIPA
ncbi:MAG TPA: lysophospholipid acyltransferase family protein [Candidatus Saccharimonadales bacterium]|nr:lysophospholipid acyltransferase family protein [Candidatus Saccharimonadales bacterium]